MKYCTKCGAPCTDAANFCTECGASLANAQDFHSKNDIPVEPPVKEEKPSSSEPFDYNYTYNTSSGSNYNSTFGNTPNYKVPNSGIAPRNIVLAIVLSLVTCGIYAIYWMIKLNDEVNALSGEVNATSGGMVFVLSLITCGIYSIYWAFKMGERVDRIKGESGNSHILFLILCILGFGIVNYCLMQDTINKAVA